MSAVDLAARIIPGESAAGFQLGLRLADMDAEVTSARKWGAGDGSLSAAIFSSSDWLVVDAADLGQRGEIRIYYGNGAVELHFSAAGVLYEVSVFSGYEGRFLDEIAIGGDAAKVREVAELFFDEGDEMYYPEDGSGFNGIAFLIEEDDGGAGVESIAGISVHDWSMR